MHNIIILIVINICSTLSNVLLSSPFYQEAAINKQYSLYFEYFKWSHYNNVFLFNQFLGYLLSTNSFSRITASVDRWKYFTMSNRFRKRYKSILGHSILIKILFFLIHLPFNLLQLLLFHRYSFMMPGLLWLQYSLSLTDCT